MKKILVIVPAYNEKKTIKKVINEIKSNFNDADILVIDDCSKDGTENILKEEKVKYIRLICNLGIGGAMQTGYIYALNNNYDIAVQIDGDGQHDPKNLKELLIPILEEKADMVIGSRYFKKTLYKTSIFRRIGMIYFEALINFITKKHIYDTTSGYRVVNKEIIRMFANDYPVDYPEVEVIIKLIKQNFRILEIPVEMHERKEGNSSITPIKSIYYMLKVTLKLMKRAIE